MDSLLENRFGSIRNYEFSELFTSVVFIVLIQFTNGLDSLKAI
jgi:hypothetical protein